MNTRMPTRNLFAVLGLCLATCLCQDFSIDLTTGKSVVTPNKGLAWHVRPTPTFSCGCSVQAVLKMTFNKSDRKRAEVKMWFEDPKDWVFNIGDSATNNGFAGDASTQHNNAEVDGQNRRIGVWGRDKPGIEVSYGQLYLDTDFVEGQVTVSIKDEVISATNGNKTFYMDSCQKLFALNGQPDNEGPVNYDVYFAMNRVVGTRRRHGTGLCRAEVTWYSE